MYGGGTVGYYCDECWESQVRAQRRARQALVGIGVVLMLLSIGGLLLMQGGGVLVPSRAYVAGMIVVFAMLVTLLVVIMARIRRR